MQKKKNIHFHEHFDLGDKKNYIIRQDQASIPLRKWINWMC